VVGLRRTGTVRKSVKVAPKPSSFNTYKGFFTFLRTIPVSLLSFIWKKNIFFIHTFCKQLLNMVFIHLRLLKQNFNEGKKGVTNVFEKAFRNTGCSF
jgi:hypothetical protein